LIEKSSKSVPVYRELTVVEVQQQTVCEWTHEGLEGGIAGRSRTRAARYSGACMMVHGRGRFFPIE